MACTLFHSFRLFPDSIIIDNWLYVMPKDLDRELVTQECISEQECASSLVLIHPSFLLSTFSRFIRLRFLKLFEALTKLSNSVVIVVPDLFLCSMKSLIFSRAKHCLKGHQWGVMMGN